MIYKLCRKCKNPIIHPAIYCERCSKIIYEEKENLKKLRESKYNKNRDPKYKEFYNSKAWRNLKETKLCNEQFKCERCSRLAVEVHHKIPIQTTEGWNLRLDYNNLEALCIRCHNVRHKRFSNNRKDNSKKIII